MRLQTMAGLVAVGGLALLLSSCSKPVSPLDAAGAGQVAGVAVASDGMLLDMLAPGQSYTPASLGASTIAPMAAGSCVTSASWGANQDNDLAPVSGTLHFGSCTSTVTASGTFTIADNNDASAYSGFRSAVKGFQLTSTSGSLTLTLSLDATFDVTRTSATDNSEYALDYTLDAAMDMQYASGTIDIQGAPTFHSTVPMATPPNDPFTAGTLTLDGTATVDTSGGKRYQVTRSGSAVIDTAACGAALAGGSDVTYSDSQGHTLELVYTGCGTGTYSFDGGTGVAFP